MKNKFGFVSLVLLGINMIIGSGIFLLPNVVAGLVGDASLWVILFCSLLATILALCFAELANISDRNGGPYLYTRAAFGEFVGFEVGIMRFTIQITAYAALTAGFAQLLGASFPALDGPVATKLIISVTIVGLAGTNLRSVNIVKYFNNATTIGKLIPLILLVLVGLFFIEPQQVLPATPNFSEGDFPQAILVMFYAFTGFSGLTIAASDIANPQRNIPRAILLVILIVTVIYILIQIIVSATLGAEMLAASKTPLVDAAQMLAGDTGYTIMLLGSIISIFGIIVSVSFCTPRMGVALSEDGLLPPAFRIMSRYGTPMWSIIIISTITLAFALSGSFVYLAAINVIARLVTYIPSCLAVIVLRKTMPDYNKGFRMPFGPFIPILGVCICIWLLLNSSQEQLLAGTAALLVGALLYPIMKWRYS